MADKRLPHFSQGSWVQTDRDAYILWAQLNTKHPSAGTVMLILSANVDAYNAVVITQKELARRCGISLRSVKTAIKILAASNWVEIRSISRASSINAYVINDQVAWHKTRDNLKRSLFSAKILSLAEVDLMPKTKKPTIKKLLPRPPKS